MSRKVIPAESVPEEKETNSSSAAKQGTPSVQEGSSLHFLRYSWDLLALFLLVLSVVTFLGLLGLTQGRLVTPWIALLRRWFGVGSYFWVLIFIYLGGQAFNQSSGELHSVPLSRIFALETSTFCLMMLFSLSNGHQLDRAEAGLDGGLVGWALAGILKIVLPPPWSTLLLFVLAVLFFLSGVGLFALLTRKMEKWAQEPEMIWTGGSTHEDESFPQPASTMEPSAPVQPAVSLQRKEDLPPLSLLTPEVTVRQDRRDIEATAGQIVKTLAEFGIPAAATGYREGPTITQFAIKPGYVEKTSPEGEVSRQKVRVSQISNLSRDLALALSAERLRIEAPVPGQDFVGIEVPNKEISVVRLRPILESSQFQRIRSPLALALGKDVSGNPVVADLESMPHMLISGTTGSGKSVCIAALTVCLVMNNSPQDLRLAMLDPKMVELVRFNGLPHLYHKVETDPERMLGVLQWAVAEMDRRYKVLESAHCRNIQTYNEKMQRRGRETMPRIVVMIDELADLMMSTPDQTEYSLVRLAQLARATGIHLIVATQRPSTDVVTGLIKANFPARIAFNVASAVDSRVILDSNGAESLLGRGDMLFLSPESGTPLRSQGVMVTDQEVERVVEYWQDHSSIVEEQAPWEELLRQEVDDSDQMLEDAVSIVRKTQHASASLLQRRLRIGYPRAARLIDELEEMGVVGPNLGGGREREVLIGPEEGSDGEFSEEDSQKE